MTDANSLIKYIGSEYLQPYVVTAQKDGLQFDIPSEYEKLTLHHG
ncbi:hypothetical protein MIZ01_1004 [Sideroxyarcus emersonii]|uniref:Uncharacterized protein n=1 Tax=Sideroxyarcus emersonii TaxID=2764705 RepID=A0AAN2BYY8_9PROT|nr:hypothetical protein MIZ01_1004 [Sideroxyarcus emersonii]